jgi:hypothetical protein
MDAPIYFRDEPRPARGGMPRFATQAEADVAMAGLSSELTWEEYAAAHPNESVGAPPLPGNSRSFSERREGYYKSTNDFPSPEDPPDSSSSDSVTRNVRPRLGTRSTHSESPEQADFTNVEPRPAWWGTRELFDSNSSDDEPPPLVIDSPLRRRGGVKQMRRNWGHFTRKKAPLLHTEPGASEPPPHSRRPPLAFPPRPGVPTYHLRILLLSSFFPRRTVA